MTRELTATEENKVNCLNDTMTSAINKVMGQDTQSYDEFINGFQHITKETVNQPKKLPSTTKPLRTDVVMKQQSQTKAERLQPNKDSQLMFDDELEEEILDSGTIATEMTFADCSSRVKLDNFVEDDMSDEETPGYIASFGQESNEEKENLTPDIPDVAAGNRQGKYNSDCKTNMVTKTVHSIHTSENMKNDDRSEEPDLMSEIVKEDEHLLSDSTENENTDESADIVEVGDKTNQMSLYPGEAELESEVAGRNIISHTNLDFLVVTSRSHDQREQICTDTTDEVEPFSLDNDFDYDNVILTPKFTMEEIDHLKLFLPRTDVKA
ncbi:intraflagellar transport-associated protein-like [Mytilus californianus]|uniref:intraflagellar transport-associated protein-like n=1 Tax=Mytilus californianus TaxID=6549 RepID=UPI0022465485|nr:intraflagellar transport-associated protein-like [Mytilus californianus]